MWKPGSLHGERVWKRGSFHGAPWIAQFGCGVGGVSRQLATDAVVCNVTRCLDSWQRMQWYATSHSVSTVGNGYSGMPWTLDQVKHLFQVSGRLRRMVSEVFGKHFGGLYSWSTMSSSFVSPSVASLSHCESFHFSCICMAQVPCLVTFVLFAPRFIHMSTMSA